jgi:hypothetical protein
MLVGGLKYNRLAKITRAWEATTLRWNYNPLTREFAHRLLFFFIAHSSQRCLRVVKHSVSVCENSVSVSSGAMTVFIASL